VTALATTGLLALVIWMDAADLTAESAFYVTAVLIIAIGVVGLVWRVWRGAS
jgi:hypothetical protein